MDELHRVMEASGTDTKGASPAMSLIPTCPLAVK